MAQIIPLSSAPEQRLRVAIPLSSGAITLNLRVYYNTQAGWWAMDVSDASGKLLVASVPLLTGAWPAGNILAPFVWLNIGSAFVINQNGAASDWPTDQTLGSDFALLWDN
jgi:hypothetical protein